MPLRRSLSVLMVLAFFGVAGTLPAAEPKPEEAPLAWSLVELPDPPPIEGRYTGILGIADTLEEAKALFVPDPNHPPHLPREVPVALLEKIDFSKHRLVAVCAMGNMGSRAEITRILQDKDGILIRMAVHLTDYNKAALFHLRWVLLPAGSQPVREEIKEEWPLVWSPIELPDLPPVMPPRKGILGIASTLEEAKALFRHDPALPDHFRRETPVALLEKIDFSKHRLVAVAAFGNVWSTAEITQILQDKEGVLIRMTVHITDMNQALVVHTRWVLLPAGSQPVREEIKKEGPLVWFPIELPAPPPVVSRYEGVLGVANTLEEAKALFVSKDPKGPRCEAPVTLLEKIDFSKHRLVLVGALGNNGSRMQIARIHEEQGKKGVLIHVSLHLNPDGNEVGQPHVRWVLIPAGALPVRAEIQGKHPAHP